MDNACNLHRFRDPNPQNLKFLYLMEPCTRLSTNNQKVFLRETAILNHFPHTKNPVNTPSEGDH